MKDPYEVPKELVTLGKNSHFGEISLITAEPRSATVTVTSDYCKCALMSHNKFDDLLSTTKRLEIESRRMIAKDVIDMIPLFNTLGAAQKMKLIEAMAHITFLPNSYICRQSAPGNSFFIITEGYCKVTVTSDDGTEKEVGRLQGGDFFGEVVLVSDIKRRTANVISIDTVSCLTLSKADFNLLLKSLKITLQEFQNKRGVDNPYMKSQLDEKDKYNNLLSKKRRITSLNSLGQRDQDRVVNLFRRFAKFTTESLWDSLYSRMWRQMLLDPQKVIEYGPIAIEIMQRSVNQNRFEAVQSLSEQILRVLDIEISRRTSGENSLIVGLMKQKNALKNEYCKNWQAYQYINLCKKMKFVKVKAFRKVFDTSATGSTAYLILRGSVRLYTKNTIDSSEMDLEQDLRSGELFGESALGGVFARLRTVQAITDVDLLEIEYTDYLNAQDKDATHMTMEERLKFLQSCSVFKVWDSFRLMRLTHYIEQTEVGKGNVIKERGTSKDFHVIVEGKVNVVSNLKMNYVLTTLSSGDSFGEEGIINKFTKNATLKLTDPFTYIAYSKVHLLTLPATHFGSFDPRTLEFIKSTYATKSKWRNERSLEMKLSRARVRRFVRSNKRIDPFRVPAQYESLLSGDIVGERDVEVGGEATIINSEIQRLPTDKNHLALLSPSRSPSPVRSNAESDSIELMKRTPSNIVRNLLLSRGDLEDYATTTATTTATTQQSNHGTILHPSQQLDHQPDSLTVEVTDGGIAFSPPLKRSSRPRSAPAVPGRLHSTAAMEEDSHQLLNVNKASLESNEGNIRVSTVQPHSAVLVPARSSTDGAAATSRPKSAAHAASRSRTPDDALQRPSSSTAAIPSNKPAISQYSESKSEPTYLKRMTHSNGKLRDLEDIPTLLAQDMDFFLASMNCRTDRQKQYFSSSIVSALRPKSARITGHSAIGLREISGPLAKRRTMTNDYQIVTGDKVMINATQQRPSSNGFPRASKS